MREYARVVAVNMVRVNRQGLTFAAKMLVYESLETPFDPRNTLGNIHNLTDPK